MGVEDDKGDDEREEGQPAKNVCAKESEKYPHYFVEERIEFLGALSKNLKNRSLMLGISVGRWSGGPTVWNSASSVGPSRLTLIHALGLVPINCIAVTIDSRDAFLSAKIDNTTPLVFPSCIMADDMGLRATSKFLYTDKHYQGYLTISLILTPFGRTKTV